MTMTRPSRRPLAGWHDVPRLRFAIALAAHQRSAVHILILNEYYPPDTSATAKMAALVAEALAEKHRVTVLAGRPSYDPDERYPYAILRRDMRNGVTVDRLGSTTYSRHKMTGRVS